MNPQFFSCESNGNHNEIFPWSLFASIKPTVTMRHMCPVCNHARGARYSGNIRLTVEDYTFHPPATEWPDALDSTPFEPGSLLVSQRVVDVLRRERVGVFDAYKATIVESRCKRLSPPAPQYYYLDLCGQIDVDPAERIRKGLPPCPGCSALFGKADDERLIPLEHTWDGVDLFRLRNLWMMSTYCTRKVVDLARRERWTNFRFIPMDILTRYASAFKGIDYLGEHWPPEKWYPDPPHAGRTIEQWLMALASEDRGDSYRATLAFLELADIKQAEPAVTGLVHLFQTGDPTRRYRAANLLKGFARRGTPVPPEIMPAVEHEMRDG